MTNPVRETTKVTTRRFGASFGPRQFASKTKRSSTWERTSESALGHPLVSVFGRVSPSGWGPGRAMASLVRAYARSPVRLKTWPENIDTAEIVSLMNGR